MAWQSRRHWSSDWAMALRQSSREHGEATGHLGVLDQTPCKGAASRPLLLPRPYLVRLQTSSRANRSVWLSSLLAICARMQAGVSSKLGGAAAATRAGRVCRHAGWTMTADVRDVRAMASDGSTMGTRKSPALGEAPNNRRLRRAALYVCFINDRAGLLRRLRCPTAQLLRAAATQSTSTAWNGFWDC